MNPGVITAACWIIALCLAWSLLQAHHDKHRCRYCGGENGKHNQDCPVDFLSREER